VRGVGIVSRPYEPRAVVRLVVDLVEAPAVERLPETANAMTRVAGVDVPCIALPESDPASADRVLAALANLAAGRNTTSKGNANVAPSGRIRA
jgi:hypothetical protein